MKEKPISQIALELRRHYKPIAHYAAELGLCRVQVQRIARGTLKTTKDPSVFTRLRQLHQQKVLDMNNIPDPSWLKQAKKMIGTFEGPGDKNNPEVVKMFAEVGHPEVIHDATPWCAAFVGAMLERSAIKSTRSLWALDYAKHGQPLNAPALGAIATKKRYNKQGKLVGGHVFFIVGWDKKYIWGLGGNQSDQVCVNRFNRADITAIRWPSIAEKPIQPTTLPYVSAAKTSTKED